MASTTRSRTLSSARASAGNRIGRFVLAPLAATLLFTVSANAWWNEEWSMRKQISIDTSSTGANITDQIGTTPLLVRLHVGNFRFASAKEDGSDLRFVAGDDKTPLKHHIEKYDSLMGEALVWVNVPNVQPGAKSDIWLYSGNDKAVAANDAKGTYDADTLLVYHFNERGTPALDSSVWVNNSQSTGQPAEGAMIGNGLRLDGQTPLTLPASPSLALAENGAFTWQAWVKPAGLQRNAAIYSRREGDKALLVGLDDGAPFVEITTNGSTQRSAAGAPVAPGGWHHLAVAATPGLVTIYLDGNAYATLAASLPALNSNAFIGGDAVPALPSAPIALAPSPEQPAGTVDGATPLPTETPVVETPVAATALPGFAGEIDELSISKSARSAGFIKIAATSQGPDASKLVLFSMDEETASWLSGYFGILLKAVTIDGWVIIAILGVMLLASWVVMVEKHGYLSRQKKANTGFTNDFRRLRNDLTQLLDGAPATGQGRKGDRGYRKNSSLYRIYQIGAEGIRNRFPEEADGSTHYLHAEAIAAIRASLDAGLIREIQALNRLMVVLTISISGGPFLGLLGTVMGVMITFAAIAMSGDVNINAIAPGVAGALMATVAGLAVAIPALFGYNWLTLRIRDLTSDMQVFVDEFTTKMAEAYSADRPRPVHALAAE